MKPPDMSVEPLRSEKRDLNRTPTRSGISNGHQNALDRHFSFTRRDIELPCESFELDFFASRSSVSARCLLR